MEGLQHSSNSDSLPSKPVVPWRGEICAAYTGPNSGLIRLDLETKSLAESTGHEEIAGCRNWNTPQDFAYGISLSLYEEDRRKFREACESRGGVAAGGGGGGVSPLRARHCIVGDPIADVFGVSVRENCCIMAVADGVNWGKKSRLAARCATHAAMEHISRNAPRVDANPTGSTIFQLLREAVTEKAQELIIKHGATLTTLSVAVICEMQTPGHHQWGLFLCAVGDSPVYIYCPHTQQLVEATLGCHDGVRDMRMAGGVLGPNYGTSPDLSNLSYAFLPVYPGDIVFAASDGVSDNFSSKVMSGVTKEEVLNEMSANGGGGLRSCCENIPHLTRVLSQHQKSLGANLSAQTVAACLINHSVEVTDKKRRLRAQCIEENIDMKREAARNAEFATRVNAATGKLDHATVVAYQVGRHYPSS